MSMLATQTENSDVREKNSGLRKQWSYAQELYVRCALLTESWYVRTQSMQAFA